MSLLRKAIELEDGATAVEYAAIASAIAAVIVSAAVLLGGHTAGLFSPVLELWLVH